MSLLLPPANTHLRTLVDVQQLADLCYADNVAQVPTKLEGHIKATEFFIDQPEVSSLCSLVRDGEYLHLMKFHRSGLVARLWTFGKVSDACPELA